MNNKDLKFVFFGTSDFSVIILDELEKAGFVPQLIVCGEDKPVGRNLVITTPKVKVWAQARNISILQPKKLDNEFSYQLSTINYELCIVASYGKIIPKNILEIPTHGTLNVHPSLLPKLRGASPIISAILTLNETGVSIMQLDEEMDHGPIVAQEETAMQEWPAYAEELENILGHQGGALLARIIPNWISGAIIAKEQDHTHATYCKKIKKEDALLDLSESADINNRKIHAYHVWPRAYFFVEKNGKKIRVIVTHAHVENNQLIIDKVIPEGKKEMNYSDFKRNF